MTEEFEGSPWNCDSIDEWNQPDYWSDYYRELFADELYPWRREHAVWRDCHRLTDLFSRIDKLPIRDGEHETRFLDVGCGISAIPYVLASWGFNVTALDSCEEAIRSSTELDPSDEELANCIPIWEPRSDDRSSYTLVEDPSRSMKRFQELKVAGGSVSFVNADWHDTSALSGPFDFIYCRNSLRLAKKPYWRASVERFHELLAPRGILILETVNATALAREVHDLLRDTGFISLKKNPSRPDNHKYADTYWPTG